MDLTALNEPYGRQKNKNTCSPDNFEHGDTLEVHSHENSSLIPEADSFNGKMKFCDRCAIYFLCRNLGVETCSLNGPLASPRSMGESILIRPDDKIYLRGCLSSAQVFSRVRWIRCSEPEVVLGDWPLLTGAAVMATVDKLTRAFPMVLHRALWKLTSLAIEER